MSTRKNGRSNNNRKNTRPKKAGRPANVARAIRSKQPKQPRKGRKGGNNFMSISRANAPVNIGTVMQSKTKKHMYQAGRGGSSVIISGYDRLQTLSVPGGAALGQVLLNLPLNPYVLTTTRLAQFSSLFMRYDVLDMEITYQSAMPTTTPGSLMLLIEQDVSEDHGPAGTILNDVELGHVTGVLHSVSGPVWRSFGTRYMLFDDAGRQGNLLTKPNNVLNLSHFGRLYVIVSNSLNNTVLTTAGTLYIKYRVEFYVDTLSTPNSSIGSFLNWSTTPIAAGLIDFVSSCANTISETGSPLLIKKGSDGHYQLDLRGQQVGTLLEMQSTVNSAVAQPYAYSGVINGLVPILSQTGNLGTSFSSFFKAVYKVLDPSSAFVTHLVTTTLPVSPTFAARVVPQIVNWLLPGEPPSKVDTSKSYVDSSVIYESDGTYHTNIKKKKQKLLSSSEDE
jgi:hypothetical protein